MSPSLPSKRQARFFLRRNRNEMLVHSSCSSYQGCRELMFSSTVTLGWSLKYSAGQSRKYHSPSVGLSEREVKFVTLTSMSLYKRSQFLTCCSEALLAFLAATENR